MPNIRGLLLTLCNTAFLCVVMGSFAAQAQNKLIVNNPDDREDSIPTGWWTYSHQTPQDISNTINTLNARAIDISVEQFSPSYLFTVTYVQNAGPYYKGWWYYFDIDATTVATNLSANNARLISLKAYDIGGGQIHFAAVMIQNTGKDNKAWWWYPGITASQITSFLAANNARLVQIHSYVTNGQTLYAVVMISNTGTDTKAWWWYTDTPSSQIASLAATNNARVIDLDYIPSDGYYNAIMVSCTGGCPAWSTYYGQTANQMLALATANGARIIDNNSYPGCGDLCFSFVLIDNSLPPLDGSNPIDSRVGQLLRAGGITGVQGLYLKQVGGPVLANLEDSFVYEPASSIKVLAHLYSMTQVQNGSVTLSTPVTHYTNGPASCPDPATPSGTETLGMALQEMMWHSDNARTREITDTFGDPNINSFGTSIGMLHTRINQIIGCGGPIPDQLTLDDAGVLYEGVANGSRLTSANRATFYSLMAGKAQYQAQGYDWTHLWDTDIPNIIAQSAPGATAAQRQAYQNQMNLAYKAGSYTLCDSSCTNVAEYFSITGVAEIPFCSGASTTLRDYVFGIYLHGAIDSSWFSGKTTVADTNFTAAKAETLREQIVAGLASCGLASVSVTLTSGNNQSATVNTAFAPLVVTIKDANNNPVPNAVVTFSAPATGASGTFGAPCSGNVCTVTSNSSGVATSPTFTANGSAGPYSVTASFNSQSVPFSLTNVGSVAMGPPFGVIDTPVSGATGQAGAINFTGWALSANTVANIALCRETLPGEPGINGLLYLGNGVLTPGARPDVAIAHPGYPNNNWGWGAQILTNQLPGTNGLPLGNGTYKLHAIAADTHAPSATHDSRDCACTQSYCTDLGFTTISADNAHSILPFGTIDTPGQGQIISGTDFVNFGWVLTPQPNIVPIDASTIMVYIDNVAVGHPVYNQFRSDIATLFPGLKNSNGGVGYFHIDTTKLSNGIHNIAWGVTDSASNAQGIGSRAFFVQN